MPRKQEKKQIAFRRIRGRIVPISIGAIAINEGFRRKKVGNVAVREGVFGTSFRAKRNFLILSKVKKRKAHKIKFVFAKDKHIAGALLREAARFAKSKGSRNIRGTLISSEVISMASKKGLRLVNTKFGERGKLKLVSRRSAKRTVTMLGNKRSKSFISTSARIPKRLKPRALLRPLSSKLLLAGGTALVLSGIFRRRK